MPEESPTPKTIVLCLDGTGDFAAECPTHVFRLFWALERSPQQVVYYDGGVGTLADDRVQNRLRRKLLTWIDLGTGVSIRRNVVEAFRFLAAQYRDGDQIVIFGFSRGAYAARTLCALIHWFGIPYPAQENIAPFAWQKIYELASGKKATEEDWKASGRMKSAFGRPAKVRFLGIWDTVSSYGLFRQRTIPQTSKLSAALTVRHAIAIDERRNLFPENTIGLDHADGRERWFAGVHRDVGGGGSPDALGLSMIPFRWVLDEAKDEEGKDLIAFKPGTKLLTEIAPDPCGPANVGVWIERIYGVIGLVPMLWYNPEKRRHTLRWLNFFHVRRIPPGAEIDPSVYARMECPNLQYRPKNVPPGG